MVEMTLSLLRVVREVAARGSITEAARVLGYSQSAVSRQIAAAESAHGVQLFERLPRGVTLTRAGEVFVRFAARTLDGFDALAVDLQAIDPVHVGRVRLGGFPSCAATLLPRAAASVMSSHNGITVTLTEGSTAQLFDLVTRGRIDVAVGAVGPGLPQSALEGLRLRTVAAGELCVAVPTGHALAAVHRVPVNELASEAWIVGRQAGNEPQFGPWPTLSDPTIRFAVREWTTRLGLVAAGLGVCVLPEFLVPLIPTGAVPVRVADPNWSGRDAVVATRDQTSDLSNLVVQAIVDEAAHMHAAFESRWRR